MSVLGSENLVEKVRNPALKGLTGEAEGALDAGEGDVDSRVVSWPEFYSEEIEVRRQFE